MLRLLLRMDITLRKWTIADDSAGVAKRLPAGANASQQVVKKGYSER